MPDCLWNTMTFIHESEDCDIARSGYVNDKIYPDEEILEDVIALNSSALIETSGTSISSTMIRKNLLRRINSTEETAVVNDNVYLIPHGQHPVNEYSNTSFLLGLYLTLFPYGVGGVENKCRKVQVSFGKHIRFFLSYHDHRFEMNTFFMFVTFNILQRRMACARARLIVSRPSFISQTVEINQLTAAEVRTVSNETGSSSSIKNSNPLLLALLNQLQTVSGSVMGSNQSRVSYRVELHSQIFFSSLPNIFITINPSDLHHPLAMKFAGVDLNLDDLVISMMPKSQERAAIAASDPVAIARFYNKLIQKVLATLIGFNCNKHKSNPGGGVLGEIHAYYGTVEEWVVAHCIFICCFG